MEKEWLYDEYVTKGRTLVEISDELGITKDSLRVWIKKYEIKKYGNNTLNSTTVEILCHRCKKEYSASLRYLVRQIRDGHTRFYCGRKCVNNAISESQQGVNNNMRNKKGDLNPAWKGGVSGLNEYARCATKDWKNQILRECNFTCFISNIQSHNLQVHHTSPFHEMRDRALSELGLNVRQSISEYTDEELDAITDKIRRAHETEKGYAIDASIHKIFHSLYGFKTNERDFLEFKHRYITGEFIKEAV
jgi:hypothetical protein